VAYQIVWSPRAAGDLEAITRYIAADNPAAATRFADRIVSHIEHLARSPLIGQVYHRSKRREIRQLVEPPYRIFYRVDENELRVVVLTLWHGARREPKI
jgi:toxin ParE1/3/4